MPKLKKTVCIAALLLMVLLPVGVVSAQEGEMPPLPGEAVLGDIFAPRGIAFDIDGNLLVAVAGSGGGDTLLMAGPEQAEPSEISAGLSGSVISVAPDGVVSTLLQGIASFAMPSETVGVYRAIPNAGSLWVLYTQAGPYNPFTNAIVELDWGTGFPRRIISLWDYEVQNNPDGNEIDSNVSDIAWTADGTMLITDAGANTLYSWTEADGLAVVQTWPDNSVPTSVEVAENGDVYVGFLGAGIAPGAGRVERWSNGELAETFSGLTGVTDILLDGDTLYAAELFLFGDQGPGPGDVVAVSAEGNTVVAGGLITPFGLAMGPDGALYISYGTIAFVPGMPGGVVRVEV